MITILKTVDPKDSILKTVDLNEDTQHPTEKPLNMLGSAELNLPEHKSIIADRLGQIHQRSLNSSDIRLILSDGELVADSLVLAGVSPFLKQLLQEALEGGPGDTGWVRDQFPVLFIPDVSKQQMKVLLTLLYTGTTKLYQKELTSLVTLTHLLKLVSIPVAIVEEAERRTGRQRAAPPPSPRATITFLPERGTGRGRPAKVMTTALTNNKQEETIHTFPAPGSGVVLETKKTPVLLPPEVSESESELEEFVEEMQVFVSDSGHVERLELLGDTLPPAPPPPPPPPVPPSDTTTVTVVQTEEGEGLDNLISVAEAFERSQQPDFNDIASPVVDGTDTEKLVRNCWICKKSLLGRNALGRHMKNVHPKVFGPYRCSYNDCGKLIESGVKMVSHMNHHTVSRSREAVASSVQSEVSDCPDVLTASAKLTDQMKKKPEVTGSQTGNNKKTKQSLVCNAGDENCSESFTTARGFIKHMKEVHSMKPWYCSPCDKRFMERQNLQFHMMSSHENKKNFACDICNKSFANPRQLYTHRALHLGKRFLCQECGYRARSSANLRGHVKARHEARQHNCPMCGKKFSSGNNLKNHMRIHTGEAPYICELCGVSFKRAHHLHSHIESKMHLDVMDKFRRRGQSVPQHLDPLRRARGRPMVEDGPVTLANNPRLETHITEVTEEGWPLHQVVVVEDGGGETQLSIPVQQVQQAEIEIIDECGTNTSIL